MSTPNNCLPVLYLDNMTMNISNPVQLKPEMSTWLEWEETTVDNWDWLFLGMMCVNWPFNKL